MEIWKLVVILSLIILLTIIGIRYVKDDKFVVIEGDLKDYVFVNPIDQCAVSVAYPEGFNKENTVVISTELNNWTSEAPYQYQGNFKEEWIQYIFNNKFFDFWVVSETPQKDWSDYTYRIVLMKYKD